MVTRRRKRAAHFLASSDLLGYFWPSISGKSQALGLLVWKGSEFEPCDMGVISNFYCNRCSQIKSQTRECLLVSDLIAGFSLHRRYVLPFRRILQITFASNQHYFNPRSSYSTSSISTRANTNSNQLPPSQMTIKHSSLFSQFSFLDTAFLPASHSDSHHTTDPVKLVEELASSGFQGNWRRQHERLLLVLFGRPSSSSCCRERAQCTSWGLWGRWSWRGPRVVCSGPNERLDSEDIWKMKCDQMLLSKFKLTTCLADSRVYMQKHPLAFHPDIRAWVANNSSQLKLSQYHSFIRPNSAYWYLF
jgi:hypothetical protein